MTSKSTYSRWEKHDLVRRALAAHFRKHWVHHTLPSGESSVEEHAGKWYVVLRSDRRVIDCYRVRNDGKLKSLVRWPPQVT